MRLTDGIKALPVQVRAYLAVGDDKYPFDLSEMKNREIFKEFVQRCIMQSAQDLKEKSPTPISAARLSNENPTTLKVPLLRKRAFSAGATPYDPNKLANVGRARSNPEECRKVGPSTAIILEVEKQEDMEDVEKADSLNAVQEDQDNSVSFKQAQCFTSKAANSLSILI